MFCHKCGEKVGPSDKFCNNCGEELLSENATSSDNVWFRILKVGYIITAFLVTAFVAIISWVIIDEATSGFDLWVVILLVAGGWAFLKFIKLAGLYIINGRRPNLRRDLKNIF